MRRQRIIRRRKEWLSDKKSHLSKISDPVKPPKGRPPAAPVKPPRPKAKPKKK